MRSKIAVILLLSIFVMIGVSTWEIATIDAQARPTLYWGSRGSSVSLCQRRLQQWGYYRSSVDGVFGAATAAAVKNFQRKNGLRTDGVVGPETWAALGLGSPTTSGSSGGAKGVTNNNDLQLLARLIHAEARGEPYIGQVAVAAVLLNRVKSSKFPNTVAGVIYQPLAFESVANGQFNLPPIPSNYRAARDAMNGWDPTYGSTFFWNPSKPVNKWIWSRKIIVEYGDHVFAK